VSGRAESALREFTYTHDPHGKAKHFKGPKVAREVGAQWTLDFATADNLMLVDVKVNLDTLLEQTPEGTKQTFYLTKDYGSKVGVVDYAYGDTDFYTVQKSVEDPAHALQGSTRFLSPIAG